MTYPNKKLIGICNIISDTFAFSLNITTCNKIKITLTIIVKFPIEILGMINDKVYGMDAIGVVPSDALVINATPNALNTTLQLLKMRTLLLNELFYGFQNAV